METITYLQNFGLDYFEFIRTHLDKFDEVLLEVSSMQAGSIQVVKTILSLSQRLMKQLDPFDPIFRPILSKVKNQNVIKEIENVRNSSLINHRCLIFYHFQKFLDFCKTLIETYILVLVKLQRLRSHKDSFLNALNVFRVNSEERQNYVKLLNFSPMSAGFSNAGCIIEGSVYLWGRTDVNCAMNRSVLQSGNFNKELSLNFY